MNKEKQPWEMIREEFIAYKKRLSIPVQVRMEASVGVPVGLTGGKYAQALKKAREKYGGATIEEIIHRNRVQYALTEGEPVPPEVLADYPDLKSSEFSDLT